MPDSQEHDLKDAADLPYHVRGEIVPQFTDWVKPSSQVAVRIWQQKHQKWRLGVNIEDACEGNFSLPLDPDTDRWSLQFLWLFMQVSCSIMTRDTIFQCHVSGQDTDRGTENSTQEACLAPKEPRRLRESCS